MNQFTNNEEVVDAGATLGAGLMLAVMAAGVATCGVLAAGMADTYVKHRNAEEEAKKAEIRGWLMDAVVAGIRFRRSEICAKMGSSHPELADWEIAEKLDMDEFQVNLAIKRWYHIF